MLGVKTPTFDITLGVSNFNFKNESMFKRVKEINVDLQSDGASSFKLLLDDSDDAFATGKISVKEGDKCVIKLGYAETSLAQIIEGNVTGVKTNRRDSSHKVFEVTGFDGLQALTRGKKRRSWEQIKDSDIAGIIAGECGLGSGKIEDSGIIQPFVAQNNITNLAFLYERARRIGFEVKVEGRDLAFRKAEKKATGVTIRWDASKADNNTCILQKCNFDATNMDQVQKVVVRGYDPKSASPIIAECSRVEGGTMGGQQDAVQKAQSCNLDTTIQVSDQPIYSQEEAERLAESILNQHADNYLTGHGACEGNPEIVCGKTVKLADIGSEMDGEFYITGAKHTLKAGGSGGAGYWTEFQISRSGR
jgi:phage protein D